MRERKAIIIIQKNARCFLVKLSVRRMHRAANRIQGFMKMKWLSSLFRNLRENVIIIQVDNHIIKKLITILEISQKMAFESSYKKGKVGWLRLFRYTCFPKCEKSRA